MGNLQGAFGAFGRWTTFELVVMVLGFVIFWPLGLAVLGFKYWQFKTGGPDLRTFATDAFRNARAAMGGLAASRDPRSGWAYDFTASSGNAAFDDWKSAELARLEQERRRLEEAHREFSVWLEALRKAKDREEFERFMRERRRPGG